MTSIIKQIPGIGSIVSVCQEASNLTGQAAPSLDELHSILEKFENALNKRDHALIHQETRGILNALTALLAHMTDEEEDIIAPFNNLLVDYIKPNLVDLQPSLEDLSEQFHIVKAWADKKRGGQQGLVARLVQAAWNQGTRELKKTAQSFSGNSVKIEPEIVSHPLLQIKRLIGTYKVHGKDYLPISQESHLSAALRHLDQRSPLFKGVEAYVLDEIPQGELHKNLDKLISFISSFLKTNRPVPFYRYVYKKAADAGQFYWNTSNAQSQIHWGKAHVAKARSLESHEALWITAAEFEALEELKEINDKLPMHPQTPSELSENLDRILLFLKNHPEKEITKEIANSALKWLSHVYNWMAEELEPTELEALDQRLNQMKQKMNQGEYHSALLDLKEEFQKGPLSRQIHESPDAVSPSNTIEQAKEKSAHVLSSPDHIEMEIWQKEMEAEQDRLVNQVGFLSAFKTVYNVLGRPVIHTDPLKFQKQSDLAYISIMQAVSEADPKKARKVFLKQLKNEIGKRDDISFFRKVASKYTAWLFMSAVSFFTRHFIGSFINYLTKTVSLPARQPLSTIHLSPIQRVNDCLVAHKKAFKRWSEDKEGNDFGAIGKKDAMEIALKNPKLNHGYEHDELVDRTTRCAIDQFLTINGLFSETIFKGIRWLDNYTNEAANPLFWTIRLALTLPFQIFFTTGFVTAKIGEWIGSQFLRVFSKQFIIRFGIVNMVLESMKDSLYKQSQYTNAIDEVLLDQLREVEKLLDKKGGGAVSHEGEEAKKLFKEAVANLMQVIDQNQQVTAEGVVAKTNSKDNAVSEIKESIKGFADDQLRDAIVQLLVIVYQSILSEKQMNELILKIITKSNESLFPKTVIRMYYGDNAELLEKTDAELKEKFAHDHGKRIEDVTDTEIEAQMKVKYNKTEQALRETTLRVIRKSVHQVVQDQGKNTLMTDNQSVIHLIDYLGLHLFEHTPSRSVNFFSKAEKKFTDYDRTQNPEILEELKQEMHEFLCGYEKKQNLIDDKVNGNGATAARTRRLNEISNQGVVPAMMRFQEEFHQFLEHRQVSRIREALSTFQDEIYQRQAELEQIKQEALHAEKHQESSADRVRTWRAKGIDMASPAILDQVESYANKRLGELAQGAFHLYKDANTFEAFLRHVVMLNFVESSGYKKS